MAGLFSLNVTSVKISMFYYGSPSKCIIAYIGQLQWFKQTAVSSRHNEQLVEVTPTFTVGGTVETAK